MVRVLLADDDPKLGQMLTNELNEIDYKVNLVTDGAAAETFIKSGLYSLVILDIGLPIKNGLDVLKIIRAEGITIPIILLTAKSGTENRIQGFDSGADHYVEKPFEFEDLVAKMKTLLRRSGDRTPDNGIDTRVEARFGDYVFNYNLSILTKDGQVISISKKERAILSTLLKNAGQVVPRERMLKEVYSADEDSEYKHLEVHVHNLRNKINVEDLIQTIRGVGYFIQKDKIKEIS